MTIKKILFLSAFVLALTPLQTQAQGVHPSVVSRPPTPSPAPAASLRKRGTPGTPGQSFPATRSFAGQIILVNPAEGYIAVEDSDGLARMFYVKRKTRLKADDETALAGRKDLTLEDFQKGQAVKVVYWPETLSATEVRLRRPKN